MSRPIQPITMPKWGIEMQEGTVTAWHADVGQRLEKNAPLLDIETQKIVNTLESPIAGTLRRILAAVGETLPVGRLLGVCADGAVTEEAIDEFIAAFRPVDASFDTHSAVAPGDLAAPTSADPADGEARISPIARKLAQKLGLDISRVRGTGRNGRVSKEDVEAHAAAQSLGAAPTEATAAEPTGTNTARREKMNSMRATIARRLLQSKQSIPHFRLAVHADVGALFAKRQALKAAGHRISVNDLLIRACAMALTRHPDVNATLEGDEILRFADADICVAVATPNGLVTPIVRAADKKSSAQIAAIVHDLVERARAGKLVKEDILGGTFTISNLGMYGVDSFDAIINPPQVAILAAGAASERMVVRSGAPVVAKMLTLTLSCDHRVVDGAAGAKFLSTVQDLLQKPESL